MPATKPDQLGPNGALLAAFLDMLAWSEGTSTSPVTQCDGYDVIVTGVKGPARFSDFAYHPFATGLLTPVLVREATPAAAALYSTASGRYQLLLRYWRSYMQTLNLKDFSPPSQDAVAVKQMRERGAEAELAQGRPDLAITSCAAIWASLPGNNYGQGGRSMEELLAKFTELRAAQQTT
jgi:muramidase (phage lysozyme)